jgi:hypothetical protein
MEVINERRSQWHKEPMNERDGGQWGEFYDFRCRRQ